MGSADAYCSAQGAGPHGPDDMRRRSSILTTALALFAVVGAASPGAAATAYATEATWITARAVQDVDGANAARWDIDLEVHADGTVPTGVVDVSTNLPCSPGEATFGRTVTYPLDASGRLHVVHYSCWPVFATEPGPLDLLIHFGGSGRSADSWYRVSSVHPMAAARVIAEPVQVQTGPVAWKNQLIARYVTTEGQPLAGQPMTFYKNRGDLTGDDAGRKVCSTTTDADGVGSCTSFQAAQVLFTGGGWVTAGPTPGADADVAFAQSPVPLH